MEIAQTCAEESRNHIAGMSPVMTNVSGFPLAHRDLDRVERVGIAIGEKPRRSARSSR
jgi:hypothetical protein